MLSQKRFSKKIRMKNTKKEDLTSLMLRHISCTLYAAGRPYSSTNDLFFPLGTHLQLCDLCFWHCARLLPNLSWISAYEPGLIIFKTLLFFSLRHQRHDAVCVCVLWHYSHPVLRSSKSIKCCCRIWRMLSHVLSHRARNEPLYCGL